MTDMTVRSFMDALMTNLDMKDQLYVSLADIRTPPDRRANRRNARPSRAEVEAYYESVLEAAAVRLQAQ